MMGKGDPCVILVTGIMASGKSTVAQRLAERFEQSVYLRGDLRGAIGVVGAYGNKRRYSEKKRSFFKSCGTGRSYFEPLSGIGIGIGQ
jgi:adenylylsulfate kinase-like enzyme